MFFSPLRRNESGHHQDSFPFLSLCGREQNFVRATTGQWCSPSSWGGGGGGGGPELLSYCGGAKLLVVPFCPTALYTAPWGWSIPPSPSSSAPDSSTGPGRNTSASPHISSGWGASTS
ncbi:UPF0598 protein C8orf82-like [Acipenser ruthenus]|uniref:UPF0598 protein C8orf82-like n=1 Tax=Acipenser ruthenus TaxID=7906 RepID=A0A444TW05_ACIRT|nr:UPF0598 protein C8orf82-like [Acipenser ruthenus]